jgi:hypothetical protein
MSGLDGPHRCTCEFRGAKLVELLKMIWQQWQSSFHLLNMITYLNENSGVGGYEYGPDYIITKFGDKFYLYSDKVTGPANIEQMKKLADRGKGLSSFISRNVKSNFEASFNNEKELREYLRRRENLN